MFIDKPIVGQGPKCSVFYVMMTNFLMKIQTPVHLIHNLYMQLLSETGLLGLLFIIIYV